VDNRATRQLSTAAEEMDCTVLDHVLAADACTSFRKLGLL